MKNKGMRIRAHPYFYIMVPDYHRFPEHKRCPGPVKSLSPWPQPDCSFSAAGWPGIDLGQMPKREPLRTLSF